MPTFCKQLCLHRNPWKLQPSVWGRCYCSAARFSGWLRCSSHTRCRFGVHCSVEVSLLASLFGATRTRVCRWLREDRGVGVCWGGGGGGQLSVEHYWQHCQAPRYCHVLWHHVVIVHFVPPPDGTKILGDYICPPLKTVLRCVFHYSGKRRSARLSDAAKNRCWLHLKRGRWVVHAEQWAPVHNSQCIGKWVRSMFEFPRTSSAVCVWERRS